MPKRRGRGEGGLEQLPSGSWRAVVVVKSEADTKKRHRVSKTFSTKPEALLWSRQQTANRESGALNVGGRATVREWADRWLAGKALTLAGASVKWYRKQLNSYILPYCGDVPLMAVTPERIMAVYQAIDAAGRSQSAKSDAGLVIRTLLGDAVKAGLLVKNPAASIPKPKRSRREMECWTAQEARAFLVESDQLPRPLGAVFRFLLDSGCRPSEAVALRWRDYDPTTGIVSIRRSLQDLGTVEELEVKDPKSAKGKRNILLSRSCRTFIDALPRVNELMFPGPTGGRQRSWMRTNYVAKQFLKAVARSKVKRIRLYDLRHTCASLLLQAGVNIKVVADRLGHADPALTLRIYAHALPSMQESAAIAGETLWGYLPT